MANNKSTMQLVNEATKHINREYGMDTNNIEDIWKASNDAFDLICNSFQFGYMQGMEAAKAEMKR